MNKIYSTLCFLFFGLTLVGQVTERSVDNIRYSLYELENIESLGDELETIDLSNLQTEKTTKVKHNQSQYLALPFYGQVRMNGEGAITHLNVIDGLQKYGSEEVQLAVPLSLTQASTEATITEYRITLGPDQLKTSFMDQLPIRPDSIRVVVRFDIVDEPHGDVRIVMEDKESIASSFYRILVVDRQVEIKIEPFGWEPVNDIAPMVDWDKNDRYVQKILTEKKIKLPLAIIEQRNGKSIVALMDVDVQPLVNKICLLYTSPSPRDRQKSRMPSSA